MLRSVSVILFVAFGLLVLAFTPRATRSESVDFKTARLCVTGYDHNRPDPFPGLGDFIGWGKAIERMPNGDLLLAHNAGYWHVSFAEPRQIEPEKRKSWLESGWPLDFKAPTGGRSMACRSTDGGKTWSKPKLILDHRLDDCPTTLFTCRDGTVLCFVNVQASWYGYRTAPEGFKNDIGGLNTKQAVLRSTDNGHTWSDPIWIDGPGTHYERGYSRPIQLKDGGILWATYNSDYDTGKEELYGAVHRSDDSGKTWRLISEIHRPGKNLDEPAIAELKDGRLIMTTRLDGGVLYSEDHGRTWTDSGRRVTTKPGKYKSPQLFVLSDGTIVNVATRGTLKAYISTDAGETWSEEISLDPSSYGYPGGVLLADESILISYCQSGRAPNRIYVMKLRVNAARDDIEMLPLK